MFVCYQINSPAIRTLIKMISHTPLHVSKKKRGGAVRDLILITVNSVEVSISSISAQLVDRLLSVQKVRVSILARYIAE